jgi:hypothetical protein
VTYTFRPARSYTERHGLFVALVGSTNSGKTYSALRLARGIAGPAGRVAVLDTEGGRTLHLKQHFDFDVMVMAPPHRPQRYVDAAVAAEAAGYSCLLVDSFSMEWRGVGGVLDWTDEEVEIAVERQRCSAAQKGWTFDEDRARKSNRSAAMIRPKMAHKLMVASFLGLRMPVIFSIRGEMTFDPDTNKEKFKAQCRPDFLFEVTVSFRLASERKGVIDLSDATSFKMEGPHADIFRNGEQLSEDHGARLEAWASGGRLPDDLSAPIYRLQPSRGPERMVRDPARWRDRALEWIAGMDAEHLGVFLDLNDGHITAAASAGAQAEADAVRQAIADRRSELLTHWTDGGGLPHQVPA